MMQLDRTKTYWILREDQLSCLASPLRGDIVDHLASANPMSIKELAAAIGKKPPSIYHHLKLLVEADLVVETGSRVVNRKSEKIYTTPSRKMRLFRALGDPENADLMRDIIASNCRQMERDFSGGLDSDHNKTSGVHRNLGYFRLVNRPSKQSLKEINQRLDEIADILWRDADPKMPLISLAWLMAPLEVKYEGGDSE